MSKNQGDGGQLVIANFQQKSFAQAGTNQVSIEASVEGMMLLNEVVHGSRNLRTIAREAEVKAVDTGEV